MLNRTITLAGCLKCLVLVLSLLMLSTSVEAQNRERGWDYSQQKRWFDRQSAKGGESAPADCFEDTTERRDAILNGNRITTQILNFGSISSPGNTITDIVWNGLGYGYEFGPFVAAEIVDVGHKDPKSVILRDENGTVVTKMASRCG